jgi:hypothetical protein
MIEARASATALARMAIAVGVTPEQLADVGREDSAEQQRRIMNAMAYGATTGIPAAGAVVDEIELIYASQTMTAQQKLELIRMVLQLGAQAEREAAGRQQKAPTENAGASREQ